jgi:hypothetical protein
VIILGASGWGDWHSGPFQPRGMSSDDKGASEGCGSLHAAFAHSLREEGMSKYTVL